MIWLLAFAAAQHAKDFLGSEVEPGVTGEEVFTDYVKEQFAKARQFLDTGGECEPVDDTQLNMP